MPTRRDCCTNSRVRIFCGPCGGACGRACARNSIPFDVFALGVILYEWLTGAHPCAPLPADSSPKVLQPHLLRHYRQTQKPLAIAGVLSSLSQLIQRRLRLNPDERPTAAEVERTLRRQLQPGPRLLGAIRRYPLRCARAAALLVSGPNGTSVRKTLLAHSLPDIPIIKMVYGAYSEVGSMRQAGLRRTRWLGAHDGRLGGEAFEMPWISSLA